MLLVAGKTPNHQYSIKKAVFDIIISCLQVIREKFTG